MRSRSPLKENFDTASRSAGGYILRTRHKDWDLERIVCIYGQLTNIEDTFRTLKNNLGLRPIYHGKDERIEGHMFVSVLAYHGVQLTHTKLKKCKINGPRGTPQDELRNWQRITTTFTDKVGDILIKKQDCRPNAKQHQLVEHLGMSPGKHREHTQIQRAESASKEGRLSRWNQTRVALNLLSNND